MSINPVEHETEPIIQSFEHKNVYSSMSNTPRGGPTSPTITEEIKNFYTIRIPTLSMEMYTDPDAAPSIVPLPKTDCLYQLSLEADASDLPPRLQGEIPVLHEHGLFEHRQALHSLIKYRRQRVKAFLKHRLKKYSIDDCAAPGCSMPLSTTYASDHLNLCDQHHAQLHLLLKNYQKSYGITVPSDMSRDEVHTMVYQSLLPSLHHLLQQLLPPSTNRHRLLVKKALMALKACIYLYRMHINPSGTFIQTIVGLFLNALQQSEPAMKRLVPKILELVLIPFAICGIAILWMADQLLSDELYLSVTCMAAGGGLVLGGTITGVALHTATAAAIAGPIAAAAGGIALFGIGLAMFIKRMKRHTPHEYAVKAHVNLSIGDDYLRQWMKNATLGEETNPK